MLRPIIYFVYQFLKVNGLIPFKFNFDKCRASPSLASLVYSIAFTFLLTLMTHYVYKLCMLIIDMDEDLVDILVLLVDLTTAFSKAFSVFFLQLVQRNKIIESINAFIKLCELTFDGDVCDKKLIFGKFFDSKLRNSCKIKSLSLLIQIIFLTLAYCMYEYNVSLYYTIQNGILILYINIVTTVSISVFYCSGMLFSAQFYHILDKKMKKLVDKSIDGGGGGSYNEKYVCTIEQISCLYEHVTVFTSKVFNIYAFQIITSLIGIIVWILASVRNSIYGFCFLATKCVI